MTMRSITRYRCPACGHEGKVVVSENDQPYSKMWERTSTEGLATRELRPGEPSYPGTQYVCPSCKTDMV